MWAIENVNNLYCGLTYIVKLNNNVSYLSPYLFKVFTENIVMVWISVSIFKLIMHLHNSFGGSSFLGQNDLCW